MTKRELTKVIRDIVVAGKWSVKDVVEAIDGYLIGTGQYRQVFGTKLNRSYVIKWEHNLEASQFCNIGEYRAWNWFYETRYAKWFAPVHFVSDDSKLLMMQRADPIKISDLPKRVPPFFGDLKASNWGMIKGKPVCIDYAIIHPKSGPLTKPKWK